MNDDLIFVGVAAGSAALASFITISHLRGARMKRAFTWDTPPRLRIAHGVPKGLDFIAVRAWQSVNTLGGHVVTSMVERGGPPEPSPGYVVVAPLDQWKFPDHAGHTVTTVNPHTKVIAQALVQLPPDATDLHALHEFLHAMGFTKHVSMRGHVFNGHAEKIGSDIRGISAAFAKRS